MPWLMKRRFIVEIECDKSVKYEFLSQLLEIDFQYCTALPSKYFNYKSVKVSRVPPKTGALYRKITK